ncbi:hypothetical protein HS962_01355 [Pantoea sp. BIGb0393]|uniref:Uncharacterized protein n=1 Tax=Pantoea nemavictus TaxID=2726955 RepID=A0ABU8PP05_9GAMM|nr:hypothetical protein [Pantoea nemavictus]MBA0034889.1 hypothetical protein [Pantoea nemavictus]
MSILGGKMGQNILSHLRQNFAGGPAGRLGFQGNVRNALRLLPFISASGFSGHFFQNEFRCIPAEVEDRR